MERFSNHLRLLWRAERLLAQQEIRMGARRFGIQALAGLVGIFGLAMLGVALFFLIEPYWGRAWAALIVAGVDLTIAMVLIVFAGSMKEPQEVAMVREMRDVALNGIRDEAALVEADFESLKADIRGFIRNPFELFLPPIINPLIGAVTKGLRAAKKDA